METIYTDRQAEEDDAEVAEEMMRRNGVVPLAKQLEDLADDYMALKRFSADRQRSGVRRKGTAMRRGKLEISYESYGPSLDVNELELLAAAGYETGVHSRTMAARTLCEAGLVERDPIRAYVFRRTETGEQVLDTWVRAGFIARKMVRR